MNAPPARARLVGRRAWLYRLALLAAVLLLGWGAAPVLAHAVPVATLPVANSVLAQSPPQLTIQFNEPVVPAFSQITLFNQTGQPVDIGPVTSGAADDSSLTVSLPSLPEGTYLVSWQVLSAVDGHTTSGSYPLGFGAVELSDLPNVNTVATQITPLSVGGRVFNLVGLALMLGILSFYLLVWRPVFGDEEPSPEEMAVATAFRRDGRRLALAGVVLVALGLLLTLLFQAGQFNLLDGTKLVAWLGTPFGQSWAFRGLVMVALAWTTSQLADDKTIWWAALVLTIIVAAATSLVSHSAALAEGTTVATAVDFAHLVAAGIWGGGLLALGVALWRSRALPDEIRTWLVLSLNIYFSTLAAGAVGLLLLSGGYLAWQHAASWTALFGTLYGLTLLLKIGLVTLTTLIAAVNLLYIRPRLNAAYEAGETGTRLRGRFGRLVWLEAALAVGVILAAGLLSDLQRGADAPLLADRPGDITMRQELDELNVELRLEPALVGNNQFDIYVEDKDGRAVTEASEVLLRFTYLSRSIGTSEATAVAVGEGIYRVDGTYLSLLGDWQVEVTVRRPDTFDAFAPFRLTSSLGGALRDGEQGPGVLARLSRFLTRTGGLVPGVVLILFTLGWGFLALRSARTDWQLVPLLMVSLLTFWLGGLQLYTFFQDYTPAAFATNPILPDAASIATGQLLYESNCATCHGEGGRGDGPAAAGLPYPPANFGAGHTATHPDGDLFYWIKEGIEETPMPAFGTTLSDEEMWHLVNYIRRLSVESTPAGAAN